MAGTRILLIWLVSAMAGMMPAQVEDRMQDRLETEKKTIHIELLGHASLRFQTEDMLIYIDPAMDFFRLEDFGKTDLILVTHSHSDHFQVDLIEKLKKKDGRVFLAQDCENRLMSARIMKNGEQETIGEWGIEAVPAYNIVHKRENGGPYHPRGKGNGYVISYGGRRIYIAGDTECIPEMGDIKAVDLAFLPANLPYTMDAAMFMKALDMLKPKRVFPYHYKFGRSVLSELIPLLEEKQIDYRIAAK